MSKKLNLPKKVTVSDLTIRDGLQSEEFSIPTDSKLFIIERLIDAGFKEIEILSFAPPKYQPQFDDWEEVLKRLPTRNDVIYSCVATSPKATERAFRAREKGYRVDRIVLGLLPGNEKANKLVTGMDYPHTWAWINKSVQIAHQMNIKVNVFLTGIFSKSSRGVKSPLEEGIESIDRLLDMGIDDVEHPDHTGEVTPDKAYDYFVRIMERYPYPAKHIFHIHDARGMGMACYFSAMMAGITRFETCIGGLGGWPSPIVNRVPTGGLKWVKELARRPGLVSTEDFLVMLEGMNLETGINVEKVLTLGKWVEKIIGRELASFCLGRGERPGAGRVPK